MMTEPGIYNRMRWYAANANAGPHNVDLPILAADCAEAADLIQSLSERIAELEGERSFVWKWVERALFDKELGTANCLSALAGYPGAPWMNGRWDVDHKPYAAAFYKRFPRASLIKGGVGHLR